MLDNYKSVADALDEYGTYEYGIDDYSTYLESELSYLEDELDNMEDVVISFYIYKNQLAAIVVEDEDFDDDIELCFEGGDYRLQNITLKSGSYRIVLDGSDGRDTYDIASFEYNYESGKFKITVDGDSFSGKLYKEGKTLNLSINGVYDYDIPDMDFAITRGAKLQKFTGDEFDIGNADEDDLYDLLDDIYDEIDLPGLLYGSSSSNEVDW